MQLEVSKAENLRRRASFLPFLTLNIFLNIF